MGHAWLPASGRTGGLLLCGTIVTAALACWHHVGAPVVDVTPSPAAAAPGVPAEGAAWRLRCTAWLDQARRQAAETYGVRFERPVPDVGSPDPDALRFPSPNGMELASEVAANRQQLGSDLVLKWSDDTAHDGWLYDAYAEDGFTYEIYEAASGPAFVRFELFVPASGGPRDTGPSWDAIREGIRSMMKRAGDRCLGRAAR